MEILADSSFFMSNFQDCMFRISQTEIQISFVFASVNNCKDPRFTLNLSDMECASWLTFHEEHTYDIENVHCILWQDKKIDYASAVCDEDWEPFVTKVIWVFQCKKFSSFLQSLQLASFTALANHWLFASEAVILYISGHTENLWYCWLLKKIILSPKSFWP